MNQGIMKNELDFYADLLGVDISKELYKGHITTRNKSIENLLHTIFLSRHYCLHGKKTNLIIGNTTSNTDQWKSKRKTPYLPQRINALHYYIDLLRMDDTEERSEMHAFSCVRALNNVIHTMCLSRHNRICREDFSKLDFGNILFNGIYWSNNGESPCSFSGCRLSEYSFRRGHSKDITALEWSADGKYVLTGSNDWSAAIWNAELGVIVHMLNGHVYPIDKVAFSADNKHCITQCRQVTKVWEINTGVCIRSIKSGQFCDDQISNDGLYLYRHYESIGHRVAFCSAIKIMDILTGRTITVIRRNKITMTIDGKKPFFDKTNYMLDPTCFSLSYGNRICAVHNGFAIWIIDINKRKTIASPFEVVNLIFPHPPFGFFRKTYYHPDECLVFSKSGDMLLLQLAKRLAVLKFSNTDTCPQLVFTDAMTFDKGYFSNNEKYCMIVTTLKDNIIIVWDCDTAKKELSLEINGQIAVSGFANDNTIWVWYTSNHIHFFEKWDIQSKARIQHLPIPTNEGFLPRTSVSPDGTKLIIGFSNGILRCIDLSSGQINNWENQFFRNRLGGIIFSKHGETGLFFDLPKDIKIWNMKKRRFIKTDELENPLELQSNRLQNEDFLEYGIRVRQQEAYYNVPNDRDRALIAAFLHHYLSSTSEQRSDVPPNVKIRLGDRILSRHTRSLWLGKPARAFYRRRRWARRMLYFPEPDCQEAFYTGENLCIRAEGYNIHISDSRTPESDIKTIEVKFDWLKNLHLLGWALPYCTIETIDSVTIWRLNYLTGQSPPAELYDTIYLCHQLYIDNCDFSGVSTTTDATVLKKILYQYGGLTDEMG